jgi:dienelactone hydrolase
MSISFQCPSCGKGYSAGDEFAGKKAKCKQCGGVFLIPALASAKPTRPPTADRYDLDEESAPLPPRMATGRPAATADAPNPKRGSAKKKRSTSDGSRSKGFFAGIGGSGFFVVLIALRLFTLGNRAAQQNGPPAVVGATAQVSTQPWTMPALPERGPMREFQPGVTFQEIRIGPGHPAPGLAPAHGMTLYFYLPPGDHEPGSLPCVLIAPAGSICVTGMDLGEGDQKEHMPYVRAGFAVLSYSLDGHIDDPNSGNDAQLRQASLAFLAAKSGLTNAKVALEWLSARVPEVDKERIYAAGHSSAGTVALLLAENEPRIKKCAAFDARSDVEANFGWLQKIAIRQKIPEVDAFFTTYNPKTNAGKVGCPVLLFHARDDSVVPVSESESFAAALKGLGKDVTLAIVPTGDHYEPMIRQGIPKAIAWFGNQKPSTIGAR